MHHLYWIAVVLAITLGNTQAAALPDEDLANLRHAVSVCSAARDPNPQPDTDTSDTSMGAAVRLAAAVWGNAESQAAVGSCCNTGRYGFEHNGARAVDWWITAAEQGHEEIKNFLLCDIPCGYLNESSTSRNSVKKLNKWLTDLAEEKDSEAQFALGRCYEGGTPGFEMDKDVGFSWIERAAENGNAAAQVELGLRYKYGRNLGERSPDPERAFALLTSGLSASSFFSPEATYALAHLYELRGTAADLEQALRLYSKTSANIDDWWSGISSLCGMARIHESKGSEEDFRQAFNLYSQARDPFSSLDSRAMRGMARMYETGRGVEQDVGQALVFFHLAGAGEDALRLANTVFNSPVTSIHAAESAFHPCILSWAFIGRSAHQLQPFFDGIPARDAGMRTCLAATSLAGVNDLNGVVISFIGFKEFIVAYFNNAIRSRTPYHNRVLYDFLKTSLLGQETQDSTQAPSDS